MVSPVEKMPQEEISPEAPEMTQEEFMASLDEKQLEALKRPGFLKTLLEGFGYGKKEGPEM